MNLLRFSVLFVLICPLSVLAAPADGANTASKPSSRSASTAVEYFPLGAVKLLDGPFLHAQELLRGQILAHDVDRFLAPFRIEAGLEPKAPKYPNWESSGLDGHSAGHYLTALAQLAVVTGDPEFSRRLDAMIAGLAEVQRANGDGYVGGVPGGRAMWKSIAAGSLKADAFGLNGGWVPWYNLHKTFAGLRDAWLIAGHAQARDVFLELCDWCDRFAATLTDEQMQAMLRTEHGGMNEVLADAYVISGDARYLRLAQRFTHRAILDPLLAGEDRLTGVHANTQIPKIVGVERIAGLSGDADWARASGFFWDTVVDHRSLAIGGNSVREHFHPREDFSGVMESREGPETCNTYNMLRLTELIFSREPAGRLADYYERALYNHILSSQHPDHGGFVYFTTMRARDYRVYSKAGECFWCCVGTGMENHGKYGAFIFARDGGDLLVNLFIAAELAWKERGLCVRQETRFPDEASTTLTLSLDQPRKFAVRVRHPGWVAADALRVRVNGVIEAVQSVPSSYVSIVREWRDGDRIEVDLPMRTRLEWLPDGSPFAAVMHGPIVLAARTGTEDLRGLVAGDGRMAHIGSGALLPLESAPMLVGEREDLVASFKPVAGRPLTFTAHDLIRPEAYQGLELEPFFRIHDSRYIVYWRTSTAEAYPQIVAQIEAIEQERLALEARTLDAVTPGLQQPEVEHAFRGEDTHTGITLGRSFRASSAWFGYELRGEAGQPMALRLSYWEGHWGEQRFRILVNDQPLAEVERRHVGTARFVDESHPIPPGLVGADGRVNVRFVASEGSSVAPVYDVRLVREPAP